jgi:predicted GNAT family acetyltransferase
MADVRRNDDVGQYEIWLDGSRVGLTQFRVRPDGVLVFPHTEVDEDRRGQGLAGELIGGALDDVRERGKTIIAQCPAVAGFIADHSEYADLQAAA